MKDPLNKNQTVDAAVLSAFDAHRVKASAAEQEAIIKAIFAHDDCSPTLKQQSSESISDDEQQVLALYEKFQETRIPQREENIDQILQEIEQEQPMEPSSNVTALPQKNNDRISNKVHLLATAAMLVISVSAVLFMFKSSPQTHSTAFDLAVRQLSEDQYRGSFDAVARANPVFGFSTKANSGSEAFIVGVSSIDLPVLLASNRNSEANSMINQLEKLAKNDSNSLIPPLLELTSAKPFKIDQFQAALKRKLDIQGLNAKQTDFYHLGRWVESCILASEVALREKEYTLLNALLEQKPTTSDNYPGEINHLLERDIATIGTTNSLAKTREIHHKLLLIKGYF